MTTIVNTRNLEEEQRRRLEQERAQVEQQEINKRAAETVNGTDTIDSVINTVTGIQRQVMDQGSMIEKILLGVSNQQPNTESSRKVVAESRPASARGAITEAGLTAIENAKENAAALHETVADLVEAQTQINNDADGLSKRAADNFEVQQLAADKVNTHIEDQLLTTLGIAQDASATLQEELAAYKSAELKVQATEEDKLFAKRDTEST